MEKIIDIIIGFIIVYSILSPFFKKKKEKKIPQQTSSRNYKIPERESLPKVEQAHSHSDDYDILKEIEKIFSKPSETLKEIPKPIPQTRRQIRTKPVDFEHSTTDSEHTRTYSELHTTEIENKIEYAKAKSLNLLQMEQIAPISFMQDSEIKQKEKNKNVFTEKIIHSLKEPKTFKQLFIISEIIGKPKALKRF